ncbi:PTS system, fructose specific enzyme IIC component [Sodalis praecaptivus]|uniref:PTS system, fructose specific enzyme IIC component n=1 Tax=Sodalis praecaptivus TaxID=1239307 RepID=W0HSP5_9GAMM|nr:PTS fructose transporter subunit IIC [Sodalis praecaptivus]AHF75168.1 PTS system, fructose specific enzyme IIC component [Sodalis praecaptivus]
MTYGIGFKKHMLTGVSYMIPVVVAAGLCMAIAKICGGPFVANATQTVPWFINQLGVVAMGLVVPVLTAGIAYSIAERPGIAPGLILGFIALEIKAGFLGGMLAGFLVGYVILAIRRFLKLPSSMQGLMPVLFIPLLSTLVVGLAFYLIVGKPVAIAQAAVIDWMSSLMGGSRMVLGAIIGAMMGFDLGGPVNKSASLFSNAMLAQGIYGPEAAKIVAGMVPPIGVAISVFISRRKRYSQGEIDAAKAAFPLGLCFITEGVLPFAAADPLRVIPACMAGAAAAAGLTMLWNVTSTVPHGGIFVIPIMGNPWGFVAALIIGSLITAAVLTMLKPVVKASDAQSDTEEEPEIDDFEISIKH